ncbi:OVARIAN TUMOR DOMAIN-containing deubiquitinating enzyme 7-like isoform X1 [Triticum dicoccoides]|uniref:OVARIAN TUMOR DOMAIN-containing deubiquitinating enzyme 7-like isoform X1 n=2 Tax=Triticum dicoccoides TaxID=85692 RepID=UPI000E7AB181|nr:OVARIAN TUMOR DOMAIN-containing deubiquitinating enzyme 7-like isoform X1 [Triticum dicoccoides]
MAQGKKKAAAASKPRKPKQRDAAEKKMGKKADMSEFRAQLGSFGLKIVEVTADGNCFFRAMGDQLEGDEGQHMKYREMVVHYIVEHREEFEPFIEDDVPFDDYCDSMMKDGTWAGNMELQAGSLVTGRNICIHMLNSPRWYINNFSGREASNMVHLSYHHGEHYNSVRLTEDPCQGPAMPVVIKTDSNVASTSNNAQTKAKDSKKSSNRSAYDDTSVKMVMAGTGCSNVAAVQHVLGEMDGDIDSAIEYMIAERHAAAYDDTSVKLVMAGTGCSSVAAVEHVLGQLDGDVDSAIAYMIAERFAMSSDNVDGDPYMDYAGNEFVYSVGDELKLSTSQNEDQMVEHKEEESCSSKDEAVQKSKNPHAKKENSKTKECSCGSAKKHKASCSLATAVPSREPPKNKGGGQGKGQKGKAKQKKKEQVQAAPVKERKSALPVPDLGALCI